MRLRRAEGELGRSLRSRWGVRLRRTGGLMRDPRFVTEGRWAFGLAAAIGRRQLRAMKRHGLPACLHAPLEFLLERRIQGDDDGPVDRVEALRGQLAGRQGVAAVFNQPAAAGTARRDEVRHAARSLRDTAHLSSVSALWGTFLYLCASSTRARTILELGSGVGISGCYLASARTCHRFITVEGSHDRARLAEAHLPSFSDTAELINAPFLTALDRVLPQLAEGLDLVFIDGDKTPGSYVDLVDRVSARLNRGALVIFDDIQWADVQRDWQTLSTRPGFSFALKAGRFGIGVWDPAAPRPRAFNLYAVGGVDLYQLRRTAEAYLGGRH